MLLLAHVVKIYYVDGACSEKNKANKKHAEDMQGSSLFRSNLDFIVEAWCEAEAKFSCLDFFGIKLIFFIDDIAKFGGTLL